MRWLGVVAVVALFCVIVQPFSPYSATAGFVALLWTGFIAVVLKICSWVTGRSERRRLAADADRQHAAWSQGDDRTAFYGRFQPPPPAGHWSDWADEPR